MTLKINKNINETVIEVAGQIDTFTAPVLEKMINQNKENKTYEVSELIKSKFFESMSLDKLNKIISSCTDLNPKNRYIKDLKAMISND